MKAERNERRRYTDHKPEEDLNVEDTERPGSVFRVGMIAWYHDTARFANGGHQATDWVLKADIWKLNGLALIAWNHAGRPHSV